MGARNADLQMIPDHVELMGVVAIIGDAPLQNLVGDAPFISERYSGKKDSWADVRAPLRS